MVLNFNKLIYLGLLFLLFWPVQYKQLINENPIVISIIVLGALVLVTQFRNIVTQFKNDRTIGVFGVFISMLVFLAFYHGVTVAGVVFVLLQVSYTIFFLGVKKIMCKPKSRELYVYLFFFVVFVLCLISFYNTLISKYSNISSEGVSYLWVYYGHNHLSYLLILAVPIIVYKYYQARSLTRRATYSLLGGIFITSLILTYARVSTISLFLSFVICSFWFQIYKFKRKHLFLSSIFMLGLVFILSFNLLMIKPFYKNIHGFSTRLDYWNQAVNELSLNPITGRGFSHNSLYFINKDNKSGTTLVHNFVIQTFLNYGVFAGTVYLSGLMLCLKQIFKENEKDARSNFDTFRIALAVGLLGVIINNLWDFDLQIPSASLIFWIFMGMAYYNPSDE